MTNSTESMTVEVLEVQKYNMYEADFVAFVGISSFRNLYSNEPYFTVSVMEGHEFDLLEEYTFYPHTWLSEDGLHELWHNEIIPEISKRFHCSKQFLDTYELINIIDEDAE